MTFNILPATAVFNDTVDMETFAGLVFQFPVAPMGCSFQKR